MRGWVERRSKNSYRLNVYLGKQADGTYKTERQSVKAESEEEADLLLAEFMTELRRGEYIKKESMTLRSFLETWLDEHVAVNNRPRTVKSYREICEYYFYTDELANFRLGDITPLHVQQFLNAHAGPAANLRRALSSALGYGVRMGVLRTNPCSSVKTPKRTKLKRKDVFTREQTKAFLEAAKEEFYHMYFATALETGMRQCEILALTWDKFDGENILVDESLEERTAETFTIGEIKTDTLSAVRNLPLSSGYRNELRQHRKWQSEYMLRCGAGFRKNNLVIHDEKGHVPCSHHIRRVMQRICKRAEVPYISPRNLRHTHATLLLAAGVHPKVVSERLGHSDVYITLNTYSFALPSMQAEARDKLESFMGE